MPHKLRVQFRVVSTPCDQIIVPSPLDDFAVIEDEDLMSVTDGR
jgi:hypothetical protein